MNIPPRSEAGGTERDWGWKSGYSHNQMLPPHGPCLLSVNAGRAQKCWPLETAHGSRWSNGQLIECTYYPRSQHQPEMSCAWWAKRAKGWLFIALYRMNNSCYFKHEYDNKGRRRLDKAEKQTAWCLVSGVIMLISGCLSFVPRVSRIGLDHVPPQGWSSEKSGKPTGCCRKDSMCSMKTG